MAVSLRTLSSGRSSLECEPADLARVASAIRERYGTPESEHHPLLTVYRFAGCSFVFQNTWDDPCLISGSAEGDRILECLHAVLAAPA